jgi:hypothetical protein
MEDPPNSNAGSKVLRTRTTQGHKIVPEDSHNCCGHRQRAREQMTGCRLTPSLENKPRHDTAPPEFQSCTTFPLARTIPKGEENLLSYRLPKVCSLPFYGSCNLRDRRHRSWRRTCSKFELLNNQYVTSFLGGLLRPFQPVAAPRFSSTTLASGIHQPT